MTWIDEAMGFRTAEMDAECLEKMDELKGQAEIKFGDLIGLLEEIADNCEMDSENTEFFLDCATALEEMRHSIGLAMQELHEKY